MATSYKKTAEEVAQLEAALEAQRQLRDPGTTAQAHRDAVAAIHASLKKLEDPVAKMRAKAAEPDPEKRTYGPGMVAKVMDLVVSHARVLNTAALQLSAAQACVDEETRLAAEAEQRRVAEQEREAERVAEDARRAAEEARRAQLEAQQRAEAEEQRRREEVLRSAKEARQREQEAARKEAAEQEAEQLRVAQAAQERARADEACRQQEQARQEQKAVPAVAEELRKQKEEETRATAEQARQQAAAGVSALSAASAPVASAVQPPHAAGHMPPIPPSELRTAVESAVDEQLQDARDLLHPWRGRVITLQNGFDELSPLLMAATLTRQIVVVNFTASWCGPCHAMGPVMINLAETMAGQAVIISVGEFSSANRELMRQSGVTAYPTFHIYREGVRVAQVVGADRNKLVSTIQSNLLQAQRAPRQVIPDLQSALLKMKNRMPYEEFVSAARILVAYVTNLVDKPNEERYRRIRVANAQFWTRLGSRPGGMDCMKAIGFDEIMQAGEMVLVCQDVPAELPQVKIWLSQLIGTAPQPPAAPQPAQAVAVTPQLPPPGPPAGQPVQSPMQGAAAASPADALPPAVSSPAASPANALPPAVSSRAASVPPTASAAHGAVNLDELTDEEMLALAIQQSMTPLKD